MANFAAPSGKLLKQATLTTVVENPAGSGEVRGYLVAFYNVDGAAACNLTVCDRIDVSNSNAASPFMPKNYEVKAKDGTGQRRLVLEPGDRLQAQASADDDIFADVCQVYAEPVS